jgi:hypothetical protein
MSLYKRTGRRTLIELEALGGWASMQMVPVYAHLSAEKHLAVAASRIEWVTCTGNPTHPGIGVKQANESRSKRKSGRRGTYRFESVRCCQNAGGERRRSTRPASGASSGVWIS